MVVRRIYQWAHLAPDKTAIIYCGRPLSYRDFALRIEHARRALTQKPLRRGSIAAIQNAYMIDAWVMTLALRSLGMTTVAVSTLDHLAALGLKDLGYIVTDMDRDPGKPSPPRPPDCVMVRVWPGFYLRDPGGELPDSQDMEIVPGGHILLTSGTTGSEKKVLLNDAIDATRQPLLAKQCGFNERSVVCLFNYGIFSAPGAMALTVWNVGGVVVVEQRPDLHLCLINPAITYAHASPAIFSKLFATSTDALNPRDTLTVGVGGGPMSPALAADVRARLTHNLFVHVASTEVGIWCITKIKTPKDLLSHRIVPERDVQVVDNAERPLPPGQIGRIRIRVIDGAAGYLDDEAASRDAFRNGFFYPGDLGVFRQDGHLELRGRVTDVINIQGIKVAPELIEKALKARLGVEEICLVALPVTGSLEQIHVAIQSQQPIDQAILMAAWNHTIRDHARRDYSQPRFHVVPTLPRTESGKIQRGVLRDRIRDGTM